MADHADARGALRQSDELVGLGERRRERLLDEHVDTGFHQLARDVKMLDGGHGDGSGMRFGFTQELIDASEGARAEFSGNSRGASGVEINDAYEFDFALLREIAIDTRVIAPEGAHADSGGFESSCQLPVSSCQSKSSDIPDRNAARTKTSRLHQSEMIAMFAPSAAAVITLSPSRSRHLPASMARQVAPAVAMVSIVFTPITG